MDSLLNLMAVAIAAAALFVSYLSWHASAQSVRASVYDRRYEVYADAERFLGVWMRDGRPDMALLPVIVGAWSRSQFLFDQPVTDYLRKVWVDSVQANLLNQIVSGKVEGDRDKAVDEFYALFREHADFDILRAKFMPELKVSPRPFSATWAQQLARLIKQIKR